MSLPTQFGGSADGSTRDSNKNLRRCFQKQRLLHKISNLEQQLSDSQQRCARLVQITQHLATDGHATPDILEPDALDVWYNDASSATVQPSRRVEVGAAAFDEGSLMSLACVLPSRRVEKGVGAGQLRAHEDESTTGLVICQPDKRCYQLQSRHLCCETGLHSEASVSEKSSPQDERGSSNEECSDDMSSAAMQPSRRYDCGAQTSDEGHLTSSATVQPCRRFENDGYVKGSAVASLATMQPSRRLGFGAQACDGGHPMSSATVQLSRRNEKGVQEADVRPDEGGYDHIDRPAHLVSSATVRPSQLEEVVPCSAVAVEESLRQLSQCFHDELGSVMSSATTQPSRLDEDGKPPTPCDQLQCGHSREGSSRHEGSATSDVRSRSVALHDQLQCSHQVVQTELSLPPSLPLVFKRVEEEAMPTMQESLPFFNESQHGDFVLWLPSKCIHSTLHASALSHKVSCNAATSACETKGLDELVSEVYSRGVAASSPTTSGSRGGAGQVERSRTPDRAPQPPLQIELRDNGQTSSSDDHQLQCGHLGVQDVFISGSEACSECANGSNADVINPNAAISACGSGVQWHPPAKHVDEPLQRDEKGEQWQALLPDFSASDARHAEIDAQIAHLGALVDGLCREVQVLSTTSLARRLELQ